MSNNLYNFVSKSGLLFPTTSKEVEEFENNYDYSDEKPDSWENPISIITSSKKSIENLNNIIIINNDVENLAMAAREGKSIDPEIKRRMQQDRKNAQGDK